MQDFEGKVAVVTGGASGIGRALVDMFGAQGMKVVVADVQEEALGTTVKQLESAGVRVLGVRTDVTRAEEVEALAQKTLDAFGKVHIVCNNAGVFAGGLSWESPLEDWEWVMGVNVRGVIHGIRTFVPLLLEHGEEGHIVNTASMAGVTSVPFTGIYYMSKHAVLSLSETFYHELTLRPSKIGVSALCPELVATSIDGCERTRPAALKTKGGPPPSETRELVEKSIREGISGGVQPSVIADRVLLAIREGRFYVLSEEDAWRRAANSRCDDIRLGRNPTFVMPVEA